MYSLYVPVNKEQKYIEITKKVTNPFNFIGYPPSVC